MNRRELMKAATGLILAGSGVGVARCPATVVRRPDQPRPGSLAEFVQWAWTILGQETPLAWNWHHDVLCEHLEAVTRGDIRKLVVSIPPASLSTTIASVCWPAWAWTKDPRSRWLVPTYHWELAIRDANQARKLVASGAYRDRYGDILQPADRLQACQFTRSMGFRKGSGIRRYGFTGYRADYVVMDGSLDFKSRHDVQSKEHAYFVWSKVLPSRCTDPTEARFVYIGPRLAKDDLPGRIMDRESHEHLCLPTEFDPNRRGATSIGLYDPRREAGDLLCPQVFSPSIVRAFKDHYSPGDYAALHQQDPVA